MPECANLRGKICATKIVRHPDCFQGQDSLSVSRGISYFECFDSYGEEFWARFGHKLKSLHFILCIIDSRSLVNALDHCPQLTSLKLTDCKFKPGEYDDIPNKPRLLNLVELNINYRYSGLRFKYDDPNAKLFEQIVYSSPNLKYLFLIRCLDDGLDYFRSINVLNYLEKKSSQLNGVSVICDEHTDKQILNKILEFPIVKLHTLQTNLPFPTSDLLIDRLTSLHSIDIDHHIDESKEIDTICDKFKELEHVKLRCETYAVSRVFRLQNLVSLDLDIDFIGYESMESLVETGFCNEVDWKLKELSLKCHVRAPLLVKLAKTHPGLTKFTLNCIDGLDDFSVQAIFKYMVLLESLTLASYDCVTGVGFNGQKMPDIKYCEDNPTGHSIRNLKRLTTLNLQYYQSLRSTLISEDGFASPELRHCRLCQVSSDFLELFIRYHPKIETLYVPCAKLSDETVDEMIERLPRLRYFHAGDDPQISREATKKLLNHCRIFIR